MHREGEEIWVKLTGAGPYGLRLGGAGTRCDPLVVAKLHKKSRARAAGVRVGDVIVAINGRRCDGVMTLQTASDLVDFSRDLNLQLVRSSTDGIQVGESEASSFRQHQHQHQHPPPPSRSLTSSPFLSDPESAASVHRHASHSTELFRHQVASSSTSSSYIRQVSPLASFARGQLQLHSRGGQSLEGEGEGSGKEGTTRWQSLEDQRKSRNKEEQEKRAVGFGGRWKPGQSTTESETKETKLEAKWLPKSSNVPKITLELTEWNGDADGSIPVQAVESSQQDYSARTPFLPKVPLPCSSARAKPGCWQPPSAVTQLRRETTFEATTLTSFGPSKGHPSDAMVHEVVIWSSKPTEVVNQEGDRSDSRKPLPWQQQQQQQQPKGVSVQQPDRAKETKKSVRWQPCSHDDQPSPSSRQPSLPADSCGVKSSRAAEEPFRWQPPQSNQGNQGDQSSTWRALQSPVVKETESEQQQPVGWQPASDLYRTTVSESSGAQQRWRPSQPPDDAADEGALNRRPGEEPTLPNGPESVAEDGGTSSSSAAVTSLFLRRIVTDGSALLAGSGHSDVLPARKEKLYADSSFYDDPEHIYPTIEDQIKLARKVAFLLTSPVNENAKGHRMFVKRREQSSKWVVDASKLHLRPRIVTRIAAETEATVLGPGEVERMLQDGDKSLHDVVPFDVCSTLAEELREERGRGGRMFARRRDQADKSSTPETNGLIHVGLPPPFHPEPDRKYVPKPDRKSATETIPPPPPPPYPVVHQPRDQVDARSEVEPPPVNRLKGMIDPPRAKITPWDSAVEYGTVEPAFEHLRGYRPHGGAPYETETVGLGCSGVLLGQSERSELAGQGHTLNQKTTPFYKQDERTTSNTRQQESHSRPHSTGFVQSTDSSHFIRQASASVDTKRYGPVPFQVGARTYN